MAVVVRMPAALAGATEGAIQSWIAVAGQTIAVGEPLAEIETEKAVVEYAAEVGGTVAQLLAEPGEKVAVGAPIAVIVAPGESDDAVAAALAEAGVSSASAPASTDSPSATSPSITEEAAGPEPSVTEAPAAPEPETATEPSKPASTPSSPPGEPADDPPPAAPDRSGSGRIFASPLVRRLAKERGLELESLSGTGPGGRIVRLDVQNAAAPAVSAPAPAAPAEAALAPATAAKEPVASEPPAHAGSATAERSAPVLAETAPATELPLTGMRRAIARRLTESKATAPHFYVTAHCRVDALLELRAQVNATAERKVSVNDFVLKAVAGALRRVPAANAVWGGDVIRQFERVDLAVAVSVHGGLLTPVITAVDTLTLTQVSATVADAAERARAGRLLQHELEGGSFAVSNLGMYGVDEFSAILNPPQSGILAVGAAKPRPVVVDGELAVGTVMTVTLSADHRVIDGALGAEWMAAFVALIEEPLGILT